MRAHAQPVLRVTTVQQLQAGQLLVIQSVVSTQLVQLPLAQPLLVMLNIQQIQQPLHQQIARLLRSQNCSALRAQQVFGVAVELKRHALLQQVQ